MSTLKQRTNVVPQINAPANYQNLPPGVQKGQPPVPLQQQQTTQQQQQHPQHDPNSPHPPGYNKRKRDQVKIVLTVVALGLLGGDSVVPTIGSAAAIICLKEGTLWSAKNLKWLVLCTVSFVASLVSWALLRHSHHAEEEKAYTLDSMLWVSAKIIQTCWGVTLSVFLCSAYVHGHNSLLEFAHVPPEEMPPLPSGPRKEPPSKKYMVY